MSVNPLSSSIANLLSTEAVSNASSGSSLASGSDFSDIFTEAFETAAEMDSADKLSSLELLAGQSDDMSGLLLDAQKAEISLNLALQIRNKALDAYDTVMRMSI